MKSFLLSLLKWVGGVVGASIAGAIAIWLTTMFTADQVIKMSGPAWSSLAQTVLDQLNWTNFAFIALMVASYLSYKYRHKFPSYKVSIEIQRVPTPQPEQNRPKLMPIPAPAQAPAPAPAPVTAPTPPAALEHTNTQQSIGVSLDVAAAADQLLASLNRKTTRPSVEEAKHQQAIDAIARQLMPPLPQGQLDPSGEYWMRHLSAEDRVLLTFGQNGVNEMSVLEISNMPGMTDATALRVASNLHADGMAHSFQPPTGARMLKLMPRGANRIKQLREVGKGDPRGPLLGSRTTTSLA